MKTFAVNKWEVNEVGDKLNEDLFKQNSGNFKGSKKLRKRKTDGEKSKFPRKNSAKAHNKSIDNSKNVDSKQNRMDPINKPKLNSIQHKKGLFKNKEAQSKVEKLNIKKIQEMLSIKKKESANSLNEPKTLRDRMMSQLRASRFRYLNETLYNNQSFESRKMFKEDPDAFKAYHTGYRQQVEKWPLNPLDIIISAVNKMPKDYIIADFGCGEARLASSVEQKVHSLDLVAINDNVTACDMAHTPLLANGVHVVVFCLSLMGDNLSDYISEANRVLKKDGTLKIADIESRFENVDEFITLLGKYGFKNTWKDLSHNLFYFMDFKKIADLDRNNKKLPKISLKSCLYKKR